MHPFKTKERRRSFQRTCTISVDWKHVSGIHCRIHAKQKNTAPDMLFLLLVYQNIVPKFCVASNIDLPEKNVYVTHEKKLLKRVNWRQELIMSSWRTCDDVPVLQSKKYKREEGGIEADAWSLLLSERQLLRFIGQMWLLLRAILHLGVLRHWHCFGVKLKSRCCKTFWVLIRYRRTKAMRRSDYVNWLARCLGWGMWYNI